MNGETLQAGSLSAPAPQSGKRGGKYLTFSLKDEEYGVEILKVREIIGMMDVTLIPRAPESIRGVINLRGKVIPVVDLRLKFGMEATKRTNETCIIVIQLQNVEIGIVVDSVSDVLDIANEEIDDAPSFGVEVNTEYILGIGKSKGEIKLLLDIEKVLSNQEQVDIYLAVSDGENGSV